MAGTIFRSNENPYAPENFPGLFSFGDPGSITELGRIDLHHDKLTPIGGQALLAKVKTPAA